MISTALKTLAAAGLFGLGALAAGTTAASARTFTQCDADGVNCVRVHCDGGESCWEEHVYSSRDYYRDYDGGYYGGYGDRLWTCDADGDDCHWTYGY